MLDTYRAFITHGTGQWEAYYHVTSLQLYRSMVHTDYTSNDVTVLRDGQVEGTNQHAITSQPAAVLLHGCSLDLK